MKRKIRKIRRRSGSSVSFNYENTVTEGANL